MQFISSKNFAVIALAVIVLGSLLYYFSKDEPVAEDLLVSEPVEDASVDGSLLSTLQELKSIGLDETLFTSSLFMSLSDFGRPIVAEPVGRPNPFAPLDRSALPAENQINARIPGASSQ